MSTRKQLTVIATQYFQPVYDRLVELMVDSYELVIKKLPEGWSDEQKEKVVGDAVEAQCKAMIAAMSSMDMSELADQIKLKMQETQDE